MKRPKVIVVCGSPGSGKTKYVKEHWKSGDLIWDMDLIVSTLTNLPLYEKTDGIISIVIAMREAMLRELRSYNQINRAWIILSVPKLWQREELRNRLNADVIVIETSQKICIERIYKDDRRNKDLGMWIDLIKKWWREYEGDNRDTIIKGEIDAI